MLLATVLLGLFLGAVAMIVLAVVEYYETKARETQYDLKTGKIIKRKK